MKTKYPRQWGPNLTFYDCASKPNIAVAHKGCGGLLTQILGSVSMRNSEKPEDTPGKIFCNECGHKLSKAVAIALKTKTSLDRLYFPGQENYALRAQSLIHKNETVRFWEWKPKDVILPENTSREVPKTLEQIKRKKSLARCIQEIKPFKQKLNAQANISDYNGIDTLDLEDRFILNTPYGFVVFDSNHWDATVFNIIRKDIRVTIFKSETDLFEWVYDSVRLAGISVESFMVRSTDDLEGAKDDSFPDINSIMAAAFPSPIRKNAPKKLPEMSIGRDRIIISIRRDRDNFWYLCLNRKIWNSFECNKIRNLVQNSGFGDLDDLIMKMIEQAEIQHKPGGHNSFQVSSDLKIARNIFFEEENF